MSEDFDERARTWDQDPAKVRRARAVAEAVRAAVPLGPATRMLEYGAGTGLVTQELAGEVGQVTLVDPSRGMREVMAEKVAAGELPADARLWGLDLAVDPAPDEQVDLVVTVMTLHHIDDVQGALRGLAAVLADGGRLCAVDLEQEDGSFHGPDSGFDGHLGFAREDLARQLEDAGFTDVRFERCYEIPKHGTTYPLFLASCRRAAR